MSHWDRVVLLELIDVVRNKLKDLTISDVERKQLLALMDGYAIKSQSIRASREDVSAMEDALARIARQFDNRDEKSAAGQRTAIAGG